MLNSYQPVIHNSWLASLNHTHSSQTFSTVLKTKQALSIQSQENNHTSHGLAQHLAQAGGSRSGETFSPRRTPLRLGEGSKKGAETHAGSHLGETPLAWAKCSLAQKNTMGRLGNPSWQKNLGEPLLTLPRRDVPA